MALIDGTRYEKIDGRVGQFTRAVVAPHPHRTRETEAEWGQKVKERNTAARVFCGDGERAEVIVRVGGTEYLVSRIDTRAILGQRCAIRVSVRAEADVPEPGDPAVETERGPILAYSPVGPMPTPEPGPAPPVSPVPEPAEQPEPPFDPSGPGWPDSPITPAPAPQPPVIGPSGPGWHE